MRMIQELYRSRAYVYEPIAIRGSFMARCMHIQQPIMAGSNLGTRLDLELITTGIEMYLKISRVEFQLHTFYISISSLHWCDHGQRDCCMIGHYVTVVNHKALPVSPDYPSKLAIIVATLNREECDHR